jgi:hypothetical protein
MKKSRYTEEQVAYALRLAESGTPVADVCRQTGIAEATFYLYGLLLVCKKIRDCCTQDGLHTCIRRQQEGQAFPRAPMGHPHEHASTYGRPSRPR